MKLLSVTLHKTLDLLDPHFFLTRTKDKQNLLKSPGVDPLQSF